MSPTHPYWPLKPGTIIDYTVFDITGGFHPATLHLDVLTRTLNTVKPYQSILTLELPHKQPTIAWAQFVTGTPTPTVDTVDMAGVLLEGLWQPSDGSRAWIGEMVNQYPPEPLLTFDTTPCAPWSGTSYVPQFDELTGKVTVDPAFPWKAAVLAKGPWGTWLDTVRTGLYECPTDPAGHVAYNYVFAHGVGLVDFWWGIVAADNSVKGWQMYATKVRP